MDLQHPTNGTLSSTTRDEIRDKLSSFAETMPPPESTPEELGTASAGARPEEEEVLHDVIRHPEDPRDGLARGVGEQSLLDPDLLRVNAVDVGRTMQGVEPLRFDPLVEAEYDGLLGIRVGAVEGPALQEAGQLSAIDATTDRDVAALTAEGLAAADKAVLKQQHDLPRLEDAVERATEEHELAVTERDEFERHAISNADYWTKTASIETTPIGGPLHWLRITPGRTKLAGVVEVLIGGLVLSGPIGQAISIDFPFGGLLVGMALSLMLFLLGWFGGKALAAVELPVRAVAAGFVLAAIWIVWRSTASMDALRIGANDEGKKILTAATLANVYVAALTSYAASIYETFTRRRELIASVPTPIDLWRGMHDRLEAAVVETKAAMLKAIGELDAVHAVIAGHKETAIGTDGRCRRREVEGVTAEVHLETLMAVTAVHKQQEVANRNAAVAAARMAHVKTRVEAYPEFGPEGAGAASGKHADQRAGLKPLHQAAIVCLLIGAAGALLGSQLVFTLGAAAAAVLLLLGVTTWSQRIGTRGRTTATQPELLPPPATTLAGVQEVPGWKVPPRSTKPKYGTAPNDPTRHH